MSAKKTMSIILISIMVGIALFILVIYLTVKTKTKNISTYRPFTEWVGKTAHLNREATLYKEKLNLNPGYPYTLIDSLHPDWQYFQDRKDLPEPEVEEIKTLPVGSEVYIDKAVQYTNGVSGFSTPTLIITWQDDEGTTYRIGYNWGEYDMLQRHEKPTVNYYRFHLAPWQETQDSTLYALPNASW